MSPQPDELKSSFSMLLESSGL